MPCRIGSPKAACRPTRSATGARGKFASRVTSGIQAGWREDHTRPGRPTPGRERRCPGDRRELAERQRLGLPHAHALQHVASAVHLPQGAVLPAERLADGPEHARRRLGQRGRLGQRARRFVEDLLVRAPGGDSVHAGRRDRSSMRHLTFRSTSALHYGFSRRGTFINTWRSLGSLRWPRTRATRRRILVVDDDRALRLALSALLNDAGHLVDQAADGTDALRQLDARRLRHRAAGHRPAGPERPRRARPRPRVPAPPIVIMMTADDTPETLLEAVRRQAHRYVRKPFAPNAIVEIIDEAIATAPAAALPIEVVSARPEWVELVAPCALEMADRIQSFVMQLETDLPEPVRESVAQAFRELLTNAIEWGGKFDPQRKVRISCVRAKRLLLYRIADPGEGFDIDKLRHAAICNPETIAARSTRRSAKNRASGPAASGS